MLPMERLAVALLLLSTAAGVSAARADDLVLLTNGQSQVQVLVDANANATAGRAWEGKAAEDLAKYLGLLGGAQVEVLRDEPAVGQALAGAKPVVVVGELALRTEPSLRTALQKVAKANPVLRADAIVVRRVGSRIYVAGSNDESQYHAASWLLQQLGCRWFLQTDLGECLPDPGTVQVGALDHAYAPPFEIRMFWLAWNGDTTGYNEFLFRNYMHKENVPSGHVIGKYVQDLIPPGKTQFNIPVSDPKTAAHVAAQLEETYAKGEHVMLGMEDGIYTSDYPGDIELQAGLQDKYFLQPVLTDPFMAFYNQVAKILHTRHPDSKAKIGFLSYANITIPPQRDIIAQPPLVTYLAPIDIDPNHGISDPQSPARQEYGAMMYRWAQVMQGRVAIYDYDQGMLVWRDIPNPSHMAFRDDVKHYRDAGILGVGTESRGAYATVFINLYLRGQLMWNPDADVAALLRDFYRRFYGPAAQPMGQYWDTLFAAWEKTIVTEHEYFVIPAIYTPQVMAELAKHHAAAMQAIAPLRAKSQRTVNEDRYVQRMDLAEAMWKVLKGYTDMLVAGSTNGDYVQAGAIGKQLLADRLAMANLNPILGTRLVTPHQGLNEPTEPGGSAAWMPGEVAQYLELADLQNGNKGKLVQLLPLEWAVRRDPNDTGLPRAWARFPADLTYWNANQGKYDLYTRKDYPTTEWEVLRSDQYAQAQGVRHPDAQSFTGYLWYKANFNLTAAQTAGPVHVVFPGMFNTCWIYVNGDLVHYRKFSDIWWLSDYRFQLDVDLTGKLKEGANDITIRFSNPHHMGGLFRRAFLYQPTGS